MGMLREPGHGKYRPPNGERRMRAELSDLKIFAGSEG
jgi:hypothetical protein